MTAISKTQRTARRRGLYRTSIELPRQVWDDLQNALARRATILKQQHGVEPNPSFIAWLRDKAKETISQFK